MEAKKINALTFNGDRSYYCCASSEGLSVYSTHQNKFIYRREKEIGGEIKTAAILERTNILAFVGSKNNTKYNENQVVIWNDLEDCVIESISFPSPVLSLLLFIDRLVVVLHNNTILFNLTSLNVILNFVTFDNPLGLCAMRKEGDGVMAVMGSERGRVRVVYSNIALYPTKELLVDEGNIIQYFSLNNDGTLLSVASQFGVSLKVFDISLPSDYQRNQIVNNNVINNISQYSEDDDRIQVKLLHEFRRGKEKAAIYSMVFSDNSDWLCVGGSSPTIHLFPLTPPRFYHLFDMSISYFGGSLIRLKLLARDLPHISNFICYFGEKYLLAICNNGVVYRFDLDLTVSNLNKSFDSCDIFYHIK